MSKFLVYDGGGFILVDDSSGDRLLIRYVPPSAVALVMTASTTEAQADLACDSIVVSGIDEQSIECTLS